MAENITFVELLSDNKINSIFMKKFHFKEKKICRITVSSLAKTSNCSECIFVFWSGQKNTFFGNCTAAKIEEGLLGIPQSLCKSHIKWKKQKHINPKEKHRQSEVTKALIWRYCNIPICDLFAQGLTSDLQNPVPFLPSHAQVPTKIFECKFYFFSGTC